MKRGNLGLVSCPFCGKYDNLGMESTFENYITEYYAYCGGCHAEGPRSECAALAGVLWNQRKNIDE